jgi:hypothetical protein
MTDQLGKKRSIDGATPEGTVLHFISLTLGEIQDEPRVLALDGGGVRGLSSLYMLSDIMEEIRKKTGEPKAPRPCEYFDLIGGTSTGGLIAIMLGRLGMVWPRTEVG